MITFQQAIDTFLHIDVYLNTFVTQYGFWTYLVLFLVIFCETGLVVTPFLPGDSLLFAAGSVVAQTSNSLSFLLLFLILLSASILGNQVNYLIGRIVGPRIFNTTRSRFFNPKHLHDAHQFYLRHGGKTIIFARFIPIIRTFAPFVAGIANMKLSHFSMYNLISALLWIGSLLSLGYFLGSIPIIKENFTWVIYGIVILSITPGIISFLKIKINHPPSK